MVELEIKPTRKFTLGLNELWHYRELFYFFTWRDIKVRYKQATLGILWAAMQPLSMMVLFTLVFSRGLGVGSEGMPYPIFAFSGLMIWNIFSNGLMNAASSMVANAGIIKKIYFPRLIIPLSSILTALFDFLFAFAVFIGLLIYYQASFPIWKLLVYTPLSILLTVITSFGLGTLLASLNIKYRDFQYALPFMIQFLLFLNPVLYSTQSFEKVGFQAVMNFNPIAGAINLMRSVFTEGVISVSCLGVQFSVALVLLMAGVYFFRKTEAYFADLV
jgi:lipopolysaccharide transport system permease protein